MSRPMTTGTTNRKTSRLYAPLLIAALGLGLGAAQPQAPTPQTPPQDSPPAPRTTTQSAPLQLPGQAAPESLPLAPYFSFREAERAAEAIQKATRKAYAFDYARSFALSNLQGDAPQLGFLELAQRLLQEAQTDYTSSQFFLSEKKAKAAEDLYKAAEHVYQAQGVLLASESGPPPVYSQGRGKGRGKGAQKRAYEAPYKAQEELFKLERESAFYTPGDDRVTQLQNAARDLLSRALTPAPTAGSLTPGAPALQPPYGVIPALSYAEAAREVAKAGRHLLEGLRGF